MRPPRIRLENSLGSTEWHSFRSTALINGIDVKGRHQVLKANTIKIRLFERFGRDSGDSESYG